MEKIIKRNNKFWIDGNDGYFYGYDKKNFDVYADVPSSLTAKEFLN